MPVFRDWKNARTGRFVTLLYALLSAWIILIAGCQPLPPSWGAGASGGPGAVAVAAPSSQLAPSPTSTPAPPPAAQAAANPTATALPTGVPSSTRAAAPTSVPTRPPTPTPTLDLPRFSSPDASRHVQKLAGDLGSRPSGSAALRESAQYLADQLAAMGYITRSQPYSFAHFRERSVQLLLRQPAQVEIVARAFVNSFSGTVEGELVSCGTGLPGEFPFSDLRGKVALIERGGITFQDKVSNAAARDASAVIIYNDRGGDFRGSLTQQAALPAVGIPQTDGRRLLEYLSRGPASVSLKVDAVTEMRQGSNVVATTQEDSQRPRVVIGAHYDSVTAGPGANDNASGVATLLELARATRGRSYPFDLVFVAFGDEEVGLVGSRRYLEALPSDQRRQTQAMLNLDMVGVGERMEFGGDADLTARALRIAQGLGYPASELALRGGSTSDHATFIDAGIPALFFYRSEDPNYHSKLDTADKVMPENLEAAGRVALRLLEELARRG